MIKLINMWSEFSMVPDTVNAIYSLFLLLLFLVLGILRSVRQSLCPQRTMENKKRSK